MGATRMRRVDEGPYTALSEADTQVRLAMVRDRGNVLEVDSNATLLHAPTRLVAETRAEFREAALELVSRAALLRAATVTIDLALTEDIDASGLGILVLAQRRARDHQITVKLVGVRPLVRQLMELTRLDYLFYIGQ